MKHWKLSLVVYGFLLGFCFPLMAQEIYSIKGQILDQENGRPLPGANIYWEGDKVHGVVGGMEGDFVLSTSSLPKSMVVEYLGYQKITKKVTEENYHQNWTLSLTGEIQGLDEITVQSKRPDENVKSVDMGRNTIPMVTLKKIPSLFGEVDLLRSLQLLPGIQSAGEGTTGIFVRGGGSDQNLIQLEGAPIYNPSHLLGFFSVFNPDALDQVDLYKGNIPANFGGRLSSLVDVTLKEGNAERVKGNGGIGTISSRLTLDGPLFSEKSTFAISARRTYADMFLKLSKNDEINSNQLYFYDLSGKVVFKPSPKDKLTFSSFYGSDHLGVSETFGFGWSNWMGSAEWDRSISEKVFLDVSGYFSRYSYELRILDEANSFKWKNALAELGGKWELTLNPKENMEFIAGMHSKFFRFSPISVIPGEGSRIEPLSTPYENAGQQDIYFTGNIDVSPRLKFEAGLRWSLYARLGGGSEYIYENNIPHPDNDIVDTLRYGTLRPMKFYQGKEPRAALRYLVSEQISLKAAYNRNYQYLQVASNSSAGLPIDRWVLSDRYIAPIISDQYSLGIFKNIDGDKWEVSLEGYYKDFLNIIDLRQGAEILFSDQVETEILSGKGWAYGAEFLLKKNEGQTTGWLGYTYSRTLRQIGGISEGAPYSPRYDRPHDLSLVLQHQFNERLSGGLTFVYSTGQAVTYPIGSYRVDNQEVPMYGTERNGDRFPDYHRMDASITLKDKNKGKKWRGSWSFGVYNLYGRKNPFSYQFTDIVNGQVNFDSSSGEAVTSRRPGVVKTYLFTFLPSITYNFEF